MSFDFLKLTKHEWPVFWAQHALGQFMEGEKMGAILDGTQQRYLTLCKKCENLF